MHHETPDPLGEPKPNTSPTEIPAFLTADFRMELRSTINGEYWIGPIAKETDFHWVTPSGIMIPKRNFVRTQREQPKGRHV